MPYLGMVEVILLMGINNVMKISRMTQMSKYAKENSHASHPVNTKKGRIYIKQPPSDCVGPENTVRFFVLLDPVGRLGRLLHSGFSASH